MASLKEVKTRINSVSSTRKITSAMKLVASSKLHKAQAAIQNMRPYQNRLNRIMTAFAGDIGDDVSSPYVVVRPVEKAVVVCLSSNSSLCGAFNANAIKQTEKVIAELRSQGVKSVEVLPIGQKIADKMKKEGFAFQSSNAQILEHTHYSDVYKLSASLMQRFSDKEIDKVVLVYNHFKSTSTQVVMTDQLLPVSLPTSGGGDDEKNVSHDFIVEPSKEALVEALIPNVLTLNLFTAVLDSLAAEHSARVVAMQTATDNADELLHDLTLMYNKTRQAAITSELLDIVGASFQ